MKGQRIFVQQLEGRVYDVNREKGVAVREIAKHRLSRAGECPILRRLLKMTISSIEGARVGVPSQKRKRLPANLARSSSRRLPTNIIVILPSHYMIVVLNVLQLYSMISALSFSRI